MQSLYQRGWGRRKPPAGTKINWSHPLARGLTFAYLFNGAFTRDSAGTNNASAVGGSPTRSAGRFGATGMGLNGTAYLDSFPTSLAAAGSKRTVIAFATVNTSNRMGLCGTRPSSATQGFVITVNRNNAGNLTVYFTGGTTFEVAAGISVGVPFMAAYTFDGTTGALYKDGKVLSSTAMSGESSSTYNGIIGDEDQSHTTGWNGSLDVMYFYNRTFSAQEVLQLYNEPFALFAQPTRRVWFVPQTVKFRRSLALDGVRTGTRGVEG